MLQLNTQTLQPDGPIVPAAEYQAYLEAQEIIEAARSRAEQILSDAKTEYEHQKQLGYEEGLTKGRMEIAEEMVSSVSKTVDYFSALESKLVEIVSRAVKKVLGETDSRDLIVQVVKQSLSLVRNQSKVTVRVCPAETEPVQARLNEIMHPYPSIQFIDVVADRRLEPGGCLLETEIGVVDASIDVQLQAIERSLTKAVGKKAS